MPLNDLGPLWEGNPKLSGFCIAIPNPAELAESARDTASTQADMTVNGARELEDYAIERFRKGLSRRMFAGQRVWQQPVEDRLLSQVEVLTRAAYNPKEGAFCDIVIYLSVTDKAITSGLIWELPRKGPEIVQRLQEVGLTAMLSQDEDLRWGFDVPNPKGGNSIDICLGFSSYEDALNAHWKEWEGENIDYRTNISVCIPELRKNIFAFIPSLDMSNDGFLKDLQHFQRTLSYFVDSLYHVLNLQPPDVSVELSVLTEWG